jgi:hypothetical protein
VKSERDATPCYICSIVVDFPSDVIETAWIRGPGRERLGGLMRFIGPLYACSPTTISSVLRFGKVASTWKNLENIPSSSSRSANESPLKKLWWKANLWTPAAPIGPRSERNGSTQDQLPRSLCYVIYRVCPIHCWILLRQEECLSFGLLCNLMRIVPRTGTSRYMFAEIRAGEEVVCQKRCLWAGQSSCCTTMTRGSSTTSL